MEQYEHRRYYDPEQEDGVYYTGRTSPPKSRVGLLAFLLILIIFLCGVITLLGLMNIRLFKSLQARQEQDNEICFVSNVPPTTLATEPTLAPVPRERGLLQLQQGLPGTDNISGTDALPLQEIYAENIDSVVSITAYLSSSTATGTGVIASQEGHIITNAHVVENAAKVDVELTDGRILPADLVGLDEISDLAVLFIQAEGLKPAVFGDSESLRVGDTVVAIGDPLGVELRGTCTDGIISAINRDVDVNGHTMTLIQTNAALNSGNSGGPLINCYGQVIGINTMKIGALADRAGVEGIGFAIPSTTVKEVTDQLITQGYVSGRPTLGLTGESLSIFYQHYYRLPAGLYITRVDRDSDAYQKGIQSGDILISIDGTAITTPDQLNAAVYAYEIGATVDAVIYRGGQNYAVELTMTEDKG